AAGGPSAGPPGGGVAAGRTAGPAERQGGWGRRAGGAGSCGFGLLHRCIVASLHRCIVASLDRCIVALQCSAMQCNAVQCRVAGRRAILQRCHPANGPWGDGKGGWAVESKSAGEELSGSNRAQQKTCRVPREVSFSRRDYYSTTRITSLRPPPLTWTIHGLSLAS